MTAVVHASFLEFSSEKAVTAGAAKQQTVREVVPAGVKYVPSGQNILDTVKSRFTYDWCVNAIEVLVRFDNLDHARVERIVQHGIEVVDVDFVPLSTA